MILPIYLLFLFLLGLAIGSFFTALVYRLPRRISILEASHCPNCQRQIRWFDLIPVMSFLLLHGNCRDCHRRIHWKYPAVELMTAVVTVVPSLLLGISGRSIISTLSILALLPVILIDFEYYLVPNGVLIVGMSLLVLIFSLLDPLSLARRFVLAGCALGIMAAVQKFGGRLFKKEALGSGDVKLAGLLGFLIPPPQFLLVMWLASLLGILFGLSRAIFFGGSPEKRIPFGSFLAGCGCLVLLWQTHIDSLFRQWLSLIP